MDEGKVVGWWGGENLEVGATSAAMALKVCRCMGYTPRILGAPEGSCGGRRRRPSSFPHPRIPQVRVRVRAKGLRG